MALLFMDSFDHYVGTDLLTKWTSTITAGGNNVNINAGAGRRGSSAYRWTNSFNTNQPSALTKTLGSADPTGVMGFAINVPSGLVGTAGLQIAELMDIGITQITLRLNADFTISVCRGTNAGTVLGTTTIAISAGIFHYIEWKVLISPTVGTVSVQINGVLALNLTGLNTRNTANSSWSAVALGVIDIVPSSYIGNSVSVFYDDVYVLDGSGSAPWNTFLGDVRVDARFPTAAGATTGWTPSTGSNWQNVDDATQNADTDYNATSTVGVTDTFTVQDSPVVGAIIYGVQHNIYTKKLDSGVASIAPVVRHSGVDNVGSNINPPISYVDGLQINQTNPGTGVQWTEAGFNAAEFGYKRTA